MASYSSYFQFGGDPTLTVKKDYVTRYGGSQGVFKDPVYRGAITSGTQDKKAAASFDAIMAGHDAASQNYVNNLQSIYSGYQQYANEFGDKAKPIMDALGGDIEEMQGYITDFGTALDEARPLMTDGIRVDPNATRTKEEYLGNVAASYGKQKEAMAQDMASQGLNPYANKGANRDMALSQAAAMTNAENTAYKDWRTQLNQDAQQKAALLGEYAGLVGQKGSMQGQIMQARGGLIDANNSIMNAKISAGQAQASGLSDLLSLQENRRQESLGLAQQQQESKQRSEEVKAGLADQFTKTYTNPKTMFDTQTSKTGMLPYNTLIRR